MNKLLEINNLGKNYHTKNGEIKAIDNISFDVYEKEFLCIIGSSGCGKSTLLNILAGLMAKKMGTKHTIARVRNPDYSSQRDFMRNQLGFSMIVNPELEAVSEICRVLSFPSAVKVDTFSRGKVELAEFFVEDHSRLNGVELNQLHKITKANILICAVSHNEDVIIPDGNYAIKPGNHLYITGTHRDLSRFCLDIGVITNRIKNVIIVVGIKTCFIF